MELTHLNDQGRARMVDVSQKESTFRAAEAEGRIRMAPETVELIRTGRWRASWPPSGPTSSSPCATPSC